MKRKKINGLVLISAILFLSVVSFGQNEQIVKAEFETEKGVTRMVGLSNLLAERENDCTSPLDYEGTISLVKTIPKTTKISSLTVSVDTIKEFYLGAVLPTEIFIDQNLYREGVLPPDELKQIGTLLKSRQRVRISGFLCGTEEKLTAGEIVFVKNPNKVRSETGDFLALFLGFNRPPEMMITNKTNRSLSITFNRQKFQVRPNGARRVQAVAGRNTYRVNAAGFQPMVGSLDLNQGFFYTWKFTIKTVRVR